MINKEFIKIIYVSMPLVLAPFLGLVFQIIVAREVDVDVFGQLSLVLALCGLGIALSDFGLRDYFLSNDQLKKTYGISVNLSLCATFGFFLWTILLLAYLNQVPNSLLLFFGFFGEFFTLAVLHKAIYLRYQLDNGLVTFSKIDAVLKLLSISSKIFIFLIDKNVLAALYFSSFMSVVCYTVWSFRSNIFSGYSFAKIGADFLCLIRDFPRWFIYTISLASYFLYFGLDKLLIESILGVDQLARYSSAMVFMAFGQLFTNVLWTLYMPRLSRGEVLWSQSRSLYLSGLFGLVIVLSYQFFAYFLFPIILPEYRDSSMLLSIASFYFIFRFPNVFIEIYCILNHKYNLFVMLRVVIGVILLISIFIALPFTGIIGAAFCVVIAELSLLLSLLYLIKR